MSPSSTPERLVRAVLGGAVEIPAGVTVQLSLQGVQTPHPNPSPTPTPTPNPNPNPNPSPNPTPTPTPTPNPNQVKTPHRRMTSGPLALASLVPLEDSNG